MNWQFQLLLRFPERMFKTSGLESIILVWLIKENLNHFGGQKMKEVKTQVCIFETALLTSSKELKHVIFILTLPACALLKGNNKSS